MKLNTNKIKSFKIYTDDTDENKVLVGNDIETALEILENNGYIVEVEIEEINPILYVEYLKKVVADIKANDEWVNDSHTKAEHRGVCNGLDMLVRHFEEEGDTK